MYLLKRVIIFYRQSEVNEISVIYFKIIHERKKGE